MTTLLSKNVHWLMAKNKIASLSELARISGIPQPTLHRMTTGEAKEPRHSTIKPIADYFGVSLSDIIDKDMSDIGIMSNVESIVARREVPLIEWDQVGKLNNQLDAAYRNDAQKVPVSDAKIGRNSYALKIVNDSMAPDFPEGSIIVVDPDRTAVNGDFVVAIDPATEQSTFKRLVQDAGRWYLRPLNAGYPTALIDYPSPDVVGVVVECTVSRKY